MSPNEKVSILLVDDQPSRLLSYEAILEGLGENLVRAHSGQEALQLLMRQEFAVVLLDVNMPTLDGFETARLIHEHPRFEKTPIIFVTAVHVTDLDRLTGDEQGAVDYVYIPVVPEILKSKVQVMVELYRSRRELVRMNAHLKQANLDLEQANDLLRAEKTRELQELNRVLEESNARLAEANRELSESATRKDEFLALLAHELRNPLNPIRNVVEILRLDPSPAHVAEGRDMIDKQVRHLTRLIDDLLDVSRISQARLQLLKERVDLLDILRAAVESSVIAAHPQQIRLAAPGAPVMVEGDVVRLTQIFTNIHTNPRKFSPPGGPIEIEVRAEEDPPESPMAEVRIRDHGIGIPREALPRLFDMFYQVDPSLTRAHGGLGIGLALVEQLIRLHGGTVQAFSEGTDKGSEFRVRLPKLTTKLPIFGAA